MAISHNKLFAAFGHKIYLASPMGQKKKKRLTTPKLARR